MLRRQGCIRKIHLHIGLGGCCFVAVIKSEHKWSAGLLGDACKRTSVRYDVSLLSTYDPITHDASFPCSGLLRLQSVKKTTSVFFL